jgi:hypothetical protein
VAWRGRRATLPLRRFSETITADGDLAFHILHPKVKIATRRFFSGFCAVCLGFHAFPLSFPQVASSLGS